MKRKLIPQGGSGLTMYLPKKWIDQHHLQAGNEVDIQEKSHSLIISTQEKTISEQKIELDISELDKTSFIKTFTALYESGFDEVKFRFKKKEMRSFKEGKIIDLSSQISNYIKRFVGFAIISQGKDYAIIKDISTQSDKEFENILRRIFYLIAEFNATIKEAITTHNFNELHRSMDIHDNITSFVSFCIRLLNKRHISDVERYNLYLLINMLDLFVDYNRWLCEDIVELKKISAAAISLISQIMVLFDFFQQYYYSSKSEFLTTFFHDRITLKQTIAKAKLSPPETILITRYSCIVEQMHFSLKSVIALTLPREQE